ncbi:hypothetical protein C2G38_2059160 [Gigaspora rosea]|uniref:Uncharacterized protein n=1 Tax=Gigaspora rosea TaxID=44941 RepID=A0A397W378_9GLOM|nr:hypothetical protein C2G38_2059160 [Gigaspora rosea]
MIIFSPFWHQRSLEHYILYAILYIAFFNILPTSSLYPLSFPTNFKYLNVYHIATLKLIVMHSIHAQFGAYVLSILFDHFQSIRVLSITFTYDTI